MSKAKPQKQSDRRPRREGGTADSAAQSTGAFPPNGKDTQGGAIRGSRFLLWVSIALLLLWIAALIWLAWAATRGSGGVAPV